jgi:hypothetical protein
MKNQNKLVHTATTSAAIPAVSAIFLAPGLNLVPPADTLPGEKQQSTVAPLNTN